MQISGNNQKILIKNTLKSVLIRTPVYEKCADWNTYSITASGLQWAVRNRNIVFFYPVVKSFPVNVQHSGSL